MKAELKRADVVVQSMPGGLKSKSVLLTFDAGAKPLAKRGWIAGVALKTAKDAQQWRDEAWRMVTKMYVEAQRDHVYAKHGENWREHCPTREALIQSVTETEKAVLKQAVELLETSE